MEKLLETFVLIKDITPVILKGLLKGNKITLEGFQDYCRLELQKKKELVRYKYIYMNIIVLPNITSIFIYID